MGVIRFKINYQVSLKRKFEKFLDLYNKSVGLEFQDLKINRHWKFENQFQAAFFIETKTNEKEAKVYELLNLANKLWPSNWMINGPHENNLLTFECILNLEDDDQPLKWAHIELEQIQ